MNRFSLHKVTCFCLSLFIVFQGHNLRAQAKQDSISVYVFLLDECVISKNYTSKLNALHDAYKEDFTFIGVFPNFSTKKEAIERWKSSYAVSYPLKTDYFKTLAKKLGASVTPEVVIYNETKEEILYKGRIDNQYVRVGKRRNIVTKQDLKDALNAIIAGEKISNPKTEAIGCFINFNDKTSKM